MPRGLPHVLISWMKSPSSDRTVSVLPRSLDTTSFPFAKAGLAKFKKLAKVKKIAAAATSLIIIASFGYFNVVL
ncbi:hypothetical protein N8912_04435 [Rhodobacteraceae bacterium]|nr:hypothetical protein [Paracoccaceae bacterium]